MKHIPQSLNPPRRTLMGPGPSEVAPSIYAAMAKPTLGHLDPQFLQIMDEIRSMLQEIFGTRNLMTLPMSGTGSAGMETVFANLIEPGDEVLIGVHGVFGTRMVDVARRCGARVTAVEQVWGRALDPTAVREAASAKKFKLLAVVHAETSTGVWQDLQPLKEIANGCGALFCVDAVTSLGGVPVQVDDWQIDAIYSGTQKCLSCPPGLAPVSFSDRAVEALKNRKAPVQSWYLDLSLIASYWGGERAYHHTAPINMLYALHEALRLTLEEGLKNRFARHALHGRALTAGLEAMGMQLRVPTSERLPQLTSVAIPDGVDDALGRRFLLDQFDLEIGGGLGPMKGNTWRIGLMGAGCSRTNVSLCLTAIRGALAAQGFVPEADPLAAAQAVYDNGAVRTVA